MCLTESIKANPEKYGYLVQQNTSIDNTIPDFNPLYMYGPQPPQQRIQSKGYFIDDSVAMLLEDADKLFEELVKNWEMKLLVVIRLEIPNEEVVKQEI